LITDDFAGMLRQDEQQLILYGRQADPVLVLYARPLPLRVDNHLADLKTMIDGAFGSNERQRRGDPLPIGHGGPHGGGLDGTMTGQWPVLLSTLSRARGC